MSLGLSHTVTYRAALSLMRALKAERPGIMLGLIEAMSVPLAGRLLAGDLDPAMLYNPPEDTRLSCAAILEEDLHLVGRPDLLDHRQEPIPFAEVLDYPLIMPHPSETSRALIENFYLRDQLPSRIMEFDSLFAITHALAEGIGCSVLAKSTVREALEGGALTARRIVSPEVKRTLYAAALRDRPHTRAAEELRRIRLAVLADEVSSGRWALDGWPVERQVISDRDGSHLELRLVRAEAVRKNVLSWQRESHGKEKGRRKWGRLGGKRQQP